MNCLYGADFDYIRVWSRRFSNSTTIDFFYFRTALIPSIINKVIGAVIMDNGRLGGGPGGHLGGGPGGRLGGGPGGRIYINKGIFLGGGGLPPSPPPRSPPTC